MTRVRFPAVSSYHPIDRHPQAERVIGLVIVPFVEDRCVAVAGKDGVLAFPSWQPSLGGDYLFGVYIAPLQAAGVRMQQFHPFAARESGAGLEVAGWVHGELRETDASRLVEPAETLAQLLEDQGRSHLAEICRWAALSYRNQTEDGYYQDNRVLLESAYLKAETVQGGSGHGGDAESWRYGRGLIVDAIHKHGTFLDVGCANGLLMESVAAWAAERGLSIDPYGLDISERLAEEARRRLPDWAERIWVGNVMSWEPPMRFDFVCTRLEYAPEWLRGDQVGRLLGQFLSPGGRLIVQSYGCSSDPSLAPLSVGDHLRRMGFAVAGEPESYEPKRDRYHRIAFLET